MNLASDEYLVKLGWVVDQGGFARFEHMLRDAARLVDNESTRIAKSFLTWQAAIVGAFASVGAGALGLADKVAQSDLQFQLFGMRMMIGTRQARELKIGLDSLGVSLEEAIWNPELQRRMSQLHQDQERMTGGLGPDFEANMLKIRDIRFEFTRMEVESQYLLMSVVNNVFKAFGGGDGILEKLRKFNDWLINNLPEISRKISTYVVPILKDVWRVMSDIGDAVSEAAMAFANIVGLLTGDKSISNSTPKWEQFATAVKHVADALTAVSGAMSDIIGLAASTVNAIAMIARGKPGEAAAVEKSGIQKYVNARSLGAIGLLAAGILASFFVGPEAGVAGAEAAEAVEGGEAVASSGVARGIVGGLGGFLRKHWMITGAAGALVGQRIFGSKSGGDGSSVGVGSPDIQQAIIATAQQMGVDPALALAVAQKESSFRQFDSSGNVLMSNVPGSHATGIFQLEPGTAAMMGVDPTNTAQNIAGGVGYLKRLLAQYGGDQQAALQHYYGSRNAQTNADYARQVIQIESGMHVTLNVAVNGGDPDQVRRSVARGIDDANAKRIQRNLMQFQGVSY